MPGALCEVAPRLWIGDESECLLPDGGAPMRCPGKPWGGIVHAAKFPCHAAVVGYDGKTKIAPSHPEYLWAERPGHLVMNLIDPPVPLFKIESFTMALDFLDIALGTEAQHALIHCNQGLSRAPSIALVYLAKRRGVLPDDSFFSAREIFLTKYPSYQPGHGLVMFLNERWSEIQ